MNCQRCEGPTEGQNIFQGNHRHLPDCIAFLKKCISELEPRAAFGDQCYQDRCENAYVEQSIANRAENEVARLTALLNTPEIEEFDLAVPLEAAHQIERWGAAHDAGKNPEDWFWLVGYLAGKALSSFKGGNLEKAKHHCISTAAALRNWHAHMHSGISHLRPGIEEPIA